MKKSTIPSTALTIYFLLAVAVMMLAVSCGDDDNPVITITPNQLLFHQITALPSQTTWENVWGVSTSDMFLMGEDGLVYRNQGGGWDSLNSGANFSLMINSAWGLASNNSYFVGLVKISETVDGVTLTHNEPFLKNYDGLSFNAETLPTLEVGLYDIWGAANDDIFAVGSDGTVLHFDGGQWSVVYSGGTNAPWLNSVWGSSASDVYVCGTGGALLHYDGATWNVVTTRTAHDLWDVWGMSDSSIYAVGSNGTVLHYDGTNMTSMPTPITKTLYGIWGTGDNDLYAVGWGGTIIHYDGNDWTIVESGTGFGFLGLWGDTLSGDIYAVGQTVMKYDGIDWQSVPIRGEPDFTDIWAGPSEIIVVGSGGHIFESSLASIYNTMSVDGGSITTDLNGVAGPAGGKAMFIVGDGGLILQRHADSTNKWQTYTSGLSADLKAVSVLSDSLAYIVGTGGLIAEYDGANWTVMSSPATEDLTDVWVGVVAGDTVVHVVGVSGASYWYDGTWHTASSGVAVDLNSVYGQASGDIWAVGDNGTLLHFSGGTWSAMASEQTENLTAVWSNGSGTLSIVGASGLAFMNGSSGNVVLETGVGIDLRAIYGRSNEVLFTAGDFNHIVHYNR